jgi:4-methyl-5(b-hydroxyethyl)-thiazole monophosphate biosynthesis
LQKNDKVLAFLRTMHSGGKLVAAICAAPLVLQDAGLLKGINATCHPSVRDKLHSAHYIDERVVVDGRIITSQAPGTAMEFSLKLIEVLFNKERVTAVNNGVLSLLQ